MALACLKILMSALQYS